MTTALHSVRETWGAGDPGVRTPGLASQAADAHRRCSPASGSDPQVSCCVHTTHTPPSHTPHTAPHTPHIYPT